MHYIFHNSHRGCVAVIVMLVSLLLLMGVQLMKTDRHLEKVLAEGSIGLTALPSATPVPPPASTGDQYHVQQVATHDYAQFLPQYDSVDDVPFPISISYPIPLLVQREPSLLYEGHNTLDLLVFTRFVNSTNIEVDQLVHLARSIKQLDRKQYYEEFRFSFLPWEERPSPETAQYNYSATTPVVGYTFNTLGISSQEPVVMSIYPEGSGPFGGPYQTPRILFPFGDPK